MKVTIPIVIMVVLALVINRERARSRELNVLRARIRDIEAAPKLVRAAPTATARPAPDWPVVLNALQARFEDAPHSDSSWERAAQAQLTDAFKKSAMTRDLSLNVACKDTICRVTMLIEKEKKEAQINAPASVLRNTWKGACAAGELAYADNKSEWIAFLGREGTTLPVLP